ncbi:hypothetical protein Bbelb_161500, partial [Branchiostoma belcheri]
GTTCDICLVWYEDMTYRIIPVSFVPTENSDSQQNDYELPERLRLTFLAVFARGETSVCATGPERRIEQTCALSAGLTVCLKSATWWVQYLPKGKGGGTRVQVRMTKSQDSPKD